MVLGKLQRCVISLVATLEIFQAELAYMPLEKLVQIIYHCNMDYTLKIFVRNAQ